MFIQFNYDGKDYNIGFTKDDVSDLKVVLHGVSYSVITEGTQATAVNRLFHSISLNSLTSVDDLSARIGSVKGVTLKKTNALGMESLSSHSLSSSKKHTVETGLIRTIPVRGAPSTTTIEERRAELNIPGVSIAVINNGEIEWASGYGNLKKPLLIQSASIGKTITALTVLSLIEDGVLESLDTDVSPLLGELWKSIDPKEMSPKMTIRQLLSHTAGTSVHGFDGYGRLEEIDNEIRLLTEQLEQLRNTDEKTGLYLEQISRLSLRLEKLNGERTTALEKPIPTSPDGTVSLDRILLGKGNSEPVRVTTLPGTEARYSGGGTLILQKVIENVTHSSFAEVVKAKVFNRCGMEDSTYDPADRPISYGYASDGSPIPGGYRIHPELAAAGPWTTPSDLARMILGIQRSLEGAPGALISRDLANEMITPQLKGEKYGLGVDVKKTSSSTYFYHGGSNVGFRCMFVANTEGQGAVIMTNSEEGFPFCDQTLVSIAEIYKWPDRDLLPTTFPKVSFSPKEIEAINRNDPIDPERWSAIEGRYEFQGHIVEVSLIEGKTFIETDEGIRLEVTPLTDSLGSYYGSDMFGEGVIRFKREGTGVSAINFFGKDHIRIHN